MVFENMTVKHDWPGRSHAETLRIGPELVQTLQRIESRPDVFSGALLLGSVSIAPESRGITG